MLAKKFDLIFSLIFISSVLDNTQTFKHTNTYKHSFSVACFYSFCSPFSPSPQRVLVIILRVRGNIHISCVSQSITELFAYTYIFCVIFSFSPVFLQLFAYIINTVFSCIYTYTPTWCNCAC